MAEKSRQHVRGAGKEGVRDIMKKSQKVKKREKENLPKLKPCPFCGGNAILRVQKVEYGLSGTIIQCKRCLVTLYSPDKRADLQGNEVINKPIDNHTEKAIEAWNRRYNNV